MGSFSLQQHTYSCIESITEKRVFKDPYDLAGTECCRSGVEINLQLNLGVCYTFQIFNKDGILWGKCCRSTTQHQLSEQIKSVVHHLMNFRAWISFEGHWVTDIAWRLTRLGTSVFSSFFLFCIYISVSCLACPFQSFRENKVIRAYISVFLHLSVKFQARNWT